MCLLEILLKIWFPTYPTYLSLSFKKSQSEVLDSGLCISLQYCWTCCEAQQVMELATASHKPMKLQTRCISIRALKFIIFDFISCSQVNLLFFEKKNQTRRLWLERKGFLVLGPYVLWSCETFKWTSTIIFY